jgi:cellulose synthase/poly-beta-1,6-N-acetylglucosamine synthase-like glycosyltransferase
MPSHDYPHFSIVIPAHNEEDWIEKSVTAAKNQDYPGEFEVIVVDNASTDRTAEIAIQSGARVVYESRRGLPQARDAGYRAAKGEIIANMDADTLPPPHWLRSFLKPFSNPSVVAVSGIFRLDRADRFLDRCYLKFHYGFWEPLLIRLLKLISRIVPCSGPNFAVRKTALDKIGGFDTTIPFWGEDLAIAMKLRRVGKVVRIPFAVVASSRRYNKDGTFKPFMIYTINTIWVLLFQKAFNKDFGRS